MSTYIKRWKQRNTNRWVCISTAFVVPITLIGLGLLLENVLRNPSEFSEAHSFTGEIDEISINRISNCDDCDNLLERDPPVSCVTEHTWVNGSIYLDIPWAIITEVAIGVGSTSPMQLPYFATWGTSLLYLTGSRLIEVSVCVKEESCSNCGSMVFGESYPPSKGELPTEHLICEQETEGNQIKVTQVNNLAGLLQPCNLRLYGKLAVTYGVRQLETFYASGKSRDPIANTTNTTASAYDFAVSNVIEGLWNTDPRKCFISAAETGGVVNIDIPWSMITHVKLLNAIDNGKRMEGVQVFVCRFPWNKCWPCGVVAETDPEKWASVYCTGGWVEGNQIKVAHSYEVLQFCEIQVFGTELIDKFRRIVPYSLQVYLLYWTTPDGDYHIWQDGGVDQQTLSRRGEVEVTGGCFWLTRGVDVYYTIPAYIVLHYVQLVNCLSPECGSTGGANICASWFKGNYSGCAATEDSLPGERHTVIFPEKPSTNEIYFTAENYGTKTQLCRVEVFGEILSNSRALD